MKHLLLESKMCLCQTQSLTCNYIKLWIKDLRKRNTLMLNLLSAAKTQRKQCRQSKHLSFPAKHHRRSVCSCSTRFFFEEMWIFHIPGRFLCLCQSCSRVFILAALFIINFVKHNYIFMTEFLSEMRRQIISLITFQLKCLCLCLFT